MLSAKKYIINQSCIIDITIRYNTKCDYAKLMKYELLTFLSS